MVVSTGTHKWLKYRVSEECSMANGRSPSHPPPPLLSLKDHLREEAELYKPEVKEYQRKTSVSGNDRAAALGKYRERWGSAQD